MNRHYYINSAARRGSGARMSLAVMLLLATPLLVWGQVTFTKITTGPLVTDYEPSCGATWADYDNDGFLDLFVANGAWFSGGHRNSLYRNLGSGEFVRVTNALTERVAVSWGGVWADYDNDGDQDIFVLHPNDARNELFRNDGGGVFSPVTNDATSIAALHTSATWVDHDQDGWLDLFVTAYTANYFFRNLRDGRFQPWTTNEVGLAVGAQDRTASSAWCDVDGDGDLDLFVGSGANGETAPDFLYRNDGGRLERVTAGSLPTVRSSFPVTWGDFNNDGLFDLFLAGEASSNMFHLCRGNWVFEDVTVASGLARSGTVYTAPAGDFDNDGDLDLYVCDYDTTDRLYANRGDGTFDSVDVGLPLTEGTKDGAGWVDYDNDGFLDLFKPCGDLSPALNLLYRNSLPQAGNSNHWLKLNLKGTVSNASAIGARVKIKATIDKTERWQVRQVTYAFWSPNPHIHFGLGDATNVEILRIEWPSGEVSQLTNLVVNDFLTIPERGVAM